MIETIRIQNQKIINLLTETENFDFFNDSIMRVKGFKIKQYYPSRNRATSEEYLKERLNQSKNKNIEFAYNCVIGETQAGSHLLNNLGFLNFNNFYTSGYNPYGFVGWHHDTDIEGYYIMMTYNKEGRGFFRYKDNKSGKVSTLNDDIGWMIRGLEIGKDDKVLWHCAVAESTRVTFLLHYDNYKSYFRAKNIMENKNE